MTFTNLSLVVSSFDKYSVCWAPFCHGLNKYWPEHPELYFITNYLEAPCGTSLKLGEDQGWAKNLLKALELIPTDYVLYTQEDYWVQRPVDNQNVVDYLDYLETGLADYIRLYPAPGPDMPLTTDERLGIIAKDANYRASLQMALWRKGALQSLVKADETPWQFEVKGSQRSKGWVDRFWCVTKRQHGLDYVFTAIINGYWSKAAQAYAEREGIPVDFNALIKKTTFNRVKDSINSYGFKLKRYTTKAVENIVDKIIPR